MGLSIESDSEDEAVVQEREVAAEPDVKPVEEAEEEVDELEEETEDEAEERESEKIEERLDEKPGGGTVQPRKRSGQRKSKAKKASPKKLRRRSKPKRR